MSEDIDQSIGAHMQLELAARAVANSWGTSDHHMFIKYLKEILEEVVVENTGC